MPISLQDKKACLNIQNDDQNCFLYCVLASLHPVSRSNNPQRVNHYTPFLREEELDIGNISMPMKIKDITKFETLNDISVNVFGYEEDTVISMRVTEKKDARHHVNVLYFNEGRKSHYVLIRNMSRLLRSQVSGHREGLFFCNYCLHACYSQEILNRHLEKCKQYGCQRTSLPEKNDSNGKIIFELLLYVVKKFY